jgi:hypothetical protein
MERLEQHYQHAHVYRAWMLCVDDVEAKEAARWLDEHHHTVVLITTDDIEDERPLYMQKLSAFTTYARFLVISYPAWHMIQDDVDVFVLPEQNLTVFGNLEEDVCGYVQRRLADAAQRGFTSRRPDATVMFLHEQHQ